jgi:DNA-binding XRE family transcriptional regulator
MVLEAVSVNKKIKPADARAELRISQSDLARRADLSKQVIVNAEKGLLISRISAHAILKALNPLRLEAGLSSLELGDVDWKVQGEE